MQDDSNHESIQGHLKKWTGHSTLILPNPEPLDLLLLLLLFEVRGSLRPVWMRQLVGAEPRGPISCHGNGSSP